MLNPTIKQGHCCGDDLCRTGFRGVNGRELHMLTLIACVWTLGSDFFMDPMDPRIGWLEDVGRL